MFFKVSREDHVTESEYLLEDGYIFSLCDLMKHDEISNWHLGMVGDQSLTLFRLFLMLQSYSHEAKY